MLKLTIATLAVVLALCSTAEAKRSSGACDGFHRCRCGTTQARHYGLPYTYKGHNLKTAIAWTKAFPHTKPRAGVVGYQRGGGPTGHVFRIVSYKGGCKAVISDDRGTYTRNICGRSAQFMDVHGTKTKTAIKRESVPAPPVPDRHTQISLNDAEKGIASTFYDHRTACAPFRMNPYKVAGIAHKTLPCGTEVQVTNLRNNRTALVRVVDRGPCTSNYCQTRMPKRVRARRFDLTAKLASRLGSNGLATVSVRVVDRTALQ